MTRPGPLRPRRRRSRLARLVRLAAGTVLAVACAAPAQPAPTGPSPTRAPAPPAASRAAPDLEALTDWHAVPGALATVLVPDASLVPWAREVAVRADRAVRIAAAFWGVPPPRVHVVVDDRDDVYNASVDPLPEAVVHLRTRAPRAGELGFAARDPLLLLLVHEAIHAVHLGGRPGVLPFPTGIVGTHVPWPPPSWLLEGVAVWAESRLTPGGGGRLDDADTRGVLRLLAVEGPWPSLADASLLTHAAWPAGEVRYLLGGAFVGRLVDRHGVPALRDALRRYETQAPWLGFAHAWRETTGGDLHAEWAGLRRALVREAEAHGPAAGDRPASFASGAAPALSPDGRRLAWVADGAVRVAPLAALRAGGTSGPAGDPAGVLALPLRAPPEDLTWWGNDRLAYARVHPTREGRLRELVVLSVATGRERVLSAGARAYDPVPLADGCLAFVHDTAPGGSELRRLCEAGPAAGEPLWAPPDGTRLAGLAASGEGRLAAVLWREGRTRLVELTGVTAEGRVATRGLPAPPGALRDPAWDGEDALLVASDAVGGVVESWRVDLRTGRAERLTATLGGVVGHAPGVAAVRRVGGPVLTWTPSGAGAGEAGSLPVPAPAPGPAVPDAVNDRDGAAGRIGATVGDAAGGDAAGGPASPDASGPAGPYEPLAGLRVLGWLPDLPAGGGAGVRVLAADPTRTVAVVGTAGVAWAARPGPLGSAYLGATLLAGDIGPVPVPGRPAPLVASARLGVLPYRAHLGTDTFLVPRLDLVATPLLAASPAVRARLGLSALALPEGIRPALEARLAAADGRADAWGVPRRGWSVAGAFVAHPVPGGGTSAGAWVDGAAWLPSPLRAASTTTLDARAGWRAPRPVPAGAWGAAAASAAAHAAWTVPVGGRFGDGRLALERVRLSLGVRGLLARDGGRWAASAGPEARLAVDLVAGYGAPFSLGLAAGGQGGDGAGAWLRLEAPRPF